MEILIDSNKLFYIATAFTVFNFILTIIVSLMSGAIGPIYLMAILTVLVLLITGFLALITTDNFVNLFRNLTGSQPSVTFSEIAQDMVEEIEEGIQDFADNGSINFDYAPHYEEQEEETFLRLAPQAI